MSNSRILGNSIVESNGEMQGYLIKRKKAHAYKVFTEYTLRYFSLSVSDGLFTYSSKRGLPPKDCIGLNVSHINLTFSENLGHQWSGRIDLQAEGLQVRVPSSDQGPSVSPVRSHQTRENPVAEGR